MSKPLCVIQGPIFNRSGYGDLATDLAKSLVRYGKYDVKIAATRWGACPSKTTLEELDTEEDKHLSTLFLQQNLNKQPDLFIQISIPNEFQPVGKYNIGITAGIETTLPSGQFIEGLNKMNLNIVTSNHVKKVFESANYSKKFEDGRQEPLRSEKPIEVCFWGANTNIYKKTEEKIDSIEKIFEKIPEKFAFLFVGQWTHQSIYNDRKDIGNLIKTFSNAFKDKSPENRPCLILKTSGVNFSVVDRDNILSRIKHIQSEIDGVCPNVYLLHGELSPTEMNGLMNHEKVKVHVSFTHGEGFGHPLLLATLSGKPLLSSNWSGHLDFLNPKYTSFFEGSIKQIHPESSNDWLIKESSWFYVAYGLAEEKMKKYYHSFEKSFTEKAEQLRLENNEKFSLDAMDKKLWNILDSYVPEFAVEKKIVLPKLKKIELPKINK